MPRRCLLLLFSALLLFLQSACHVDAGADLEFAGDGQLREPEAFPEWARVVAGASNGLIGSSAVMISPRVALVPHQVQGASYWVLTYEGDRLVTVSATAQPLPNGVVALVLRRPVAKGDFRFPVIPVEVGSAEKHAIGAYGEVEYSAGAETELEGLDRPILSPALAHGGSRAIAATQSRPAVDVILTDVWLARGDSGAALFERVRSTPRRLIGLGLTNIGAAPGVPLPDGGWSSSAWLDLTRADVREAIAALQAAHQ